MNGTNSLPGARTGRAVTAAASLAHPALGVAVRAALDGRARRNPLTRWLPISAAAVALAAIVGVGVFAGAPGAEPTCAAARTGLDDTELARVLHTIRMIESSGDYTAPAATSTASGAYQFLDSTWANYSGYPRAFHAPPAVQDAKATEQIDAILAVNDGDVTTVPVVWYLGHVPPTASTEWDTIPNPGAGNTLTPRQYQARWMAAFTDPTLAVGRGAAAASSASLTCVGVIGVGSFAIPAGVDQLHATSISWGGYRNGEIPYEALRYSPLSGYAYPPASQAWDQLHAAALTAGFDLRGWSYRPATSEGSLAGGSNHGWGLAIDITVLVVGLHYPTVEAAFTSPEYQWLVANAAKYGWINPTWAKPLSLGGNGHGGHVGDHCCYLEPWHWEWAAFMNQPTPSAIVSARPALVPT